MRPRRRSGDQVAGPSVQTIFARRVTPASLVPYVTCAATGTVSFSARIRWLIGENVHMAKRPGRVEALNLDRTVSFSDAVIAIAMTLLAIDLPLPRGATSRELWQDFASNLPTSYLSFAISFTVIAIFWYQHHRFFDRIAHVNTQLTIWNLVSLFAIVVIPFSTKLLSVGDGENSLGPVLYASTLLLWGAAFVLMALAARRSNLWRDGTAGSTSGDIIFGTATALSMFAVSIPIAFVNPSLAMLSWLLIPVVSALSDRIRSRVSLHQHDSH